MDPITSAIVAVLPGLAAGTLTSLIKDSYQGLKAVIKRKWGDSGGVSQAIQALESNPSSKAQAALLDEKVVESKLCADPEVVAVLKQLVDLLKAHNIGGSAVTNITFSQSGGLLQGIGAAQTVNVAEMSFGPPPSR